MAELVRVSMSGTPEPSGLHTALRGDQQDGDVILTIPATNGSVTVRLDPTDIEELLSAVQGAGGPLTE
jgi:hypothetical protein